MSQRDKKQQKRKKKLEQRRKRALGAPRQVRTSAQAVPSEPEQLIREVEMVGYPTDTIDAHCHLALENELPPGFSSRAQRRAARLASGPIDWELALRGAPSRDVFAGLDLANPSHLDEAVSIFCSTLEEGTFAQWEGVIREEAALPHSEPRQDGLGDLIDFGNDEDDDRSLYIDDLSRPHEPWYRTLQRLANALLDPVIRTDHDYCDALLDGWEMIEGTLEGCAEGLSLPAGARDPLEVLAPDVVHTLRVRACVSDLVGIGQDFRPGLTLANEEEQHRVDELLERLREQRASVEFLQLTLERLTQLVELPPGEDTLLADLLIARLGPLDPHELLAARLVPSGLANAASSEP